MLKKGGLDDDHIVVMIADDLAQNYMNPHPGKVFNRPGGEDVYEGVPLVRLMLLRDMHCLLCHECKSRELCMLHEGPVRSSFRPIPAECYSLGGSFICTVAFAVHPR